MEQLTTPELIKLLESVSKEIMNHTASSLKCKILAELNRRLK